MTALAIALFCLGAPVASDTGAVVDLNAASIEELETLPGIGPKKAAAIIAHRPYVRVTQLLDVKGVGRKTLDRLRYRLIIGAVRPAPAAPAPAVSAELPPASRSPALR